MCRQTAFLIVLILGLMPAAVAAQSPEADYVRRLEQQRREKDEFFRRDSDSPLPARVRKNFQGLPYFPIDAQFRCSGRMIRAARPEKLDLITSDGRSKKALRYGVLEFQLAGRTHRLQVYKLLRLPSAYRHQLFVPFTDLTSGHESYGGGRYLDLQELPDDDYVIDFNLSYNPSCAYGRDEFSCPIPPRENHLHVRIAAGERNWGK